jgi:hypothetical protein
MPEITFIVDDLRGAILVENNKDLVAEIVEHLRWTFSETQDSRLRSSAQNH